MTHEHARIEILFLLATEDRPPTQEQLCNVLGLSSRNAVGHHIAGLVEEGLVVRSSGWRGLRLTATGQAVAAYLRAEREGDPVFRRMIRKHFEVYSYAAQRAVEQLAEARDKDYALNRAGLHRTLPGGSREPERKASTRDCIRALKGHSTWDEAAEEVGIQTGALFSRMQVLFNQAARARAESKGVRFLSSLRREEPVPVASG